jgi:hypothetical protein
MWEGQKGKGMHGVKEIGMVVVGVWRCVCLCMIKQSLSSSHYQATV